MLKCKTISSLWGEQSISLCSRALHTDTFVLVCKHCSKVESMTNCCLQTVWMKRSLIFQCFKKCLKSVTSGYRAYECRLFLCLAMAKSSQKHSTLGFFFVRAALQSRTGYLKGSFQSSQKVNMVKGGGAEHRPNKTSALYTAGRAHY